MCVVTACMGLRVSETLGLKWGDFDWDDLRVRIQRSWVVGGEDDVKTKYSKKWMQVDPILAELLLEHKGRTATGAKDTDWVFVNPETGKPYWPGASREKVRKNLIPWSGPRLPEKSRPQPHTYLRNIQKGKRGKKSWYQYVFLASLLRDEGESRRWSSNKRFSVVTVHWRSLQLGCMDPWGDAIDSSDECCSDLMFNSRGCL